MKWKTILWRIRKHYKKILKQDLNINVEESHTVFKNRDIPKLV